MKTDSTFSYRKILLLGFGFMGVSLLWAIYNAYVPIFLQAGRSDYSTTAQVSGFGLGADTTGFIMTLDNIAALFILPYVGFFSDRLRTRWGRRKPFLAAGAPVAFLGFIGIPMFLGNSLVLFMAAICVTLLAMDAFRTPVISLMPDITPSPYRSQANGMVNLMGGVGGVLAFAIGGLLFRVSPAAPFLFGGLTMLAGIGIVLLFIREPAGWVAESETGITSFRDQFRQLDLFRDRSLPMILGAIFFWFLGYNALEVFFTSFAVNSLNLDSGEATFLLAYFSLAIIVFSPLSGWIGGKWGRKRSIGGGIVAFALLLAIGSRMTTPVQAKVLLPFCGIAWSLILVNSLPMVVDMAPQDQLGSYTGLYYLASQLSAIAGPILAGKIIDLFQNNYRISFLYGSVTLGIALLFLLRVKRGEALPEVSPGLS
ncbi:MAG: MFS transporter [Candidatus Neomarinimicrobiota bacterium]|nr:MAG: MFS transporter [Candidatus Neomarinimicrobiota bacterium]